MHHDVCIVGGGSVGSTLAYFLYRSGFTDIPVYYASRESYEAVKNLGGILVCDVKRSIVQLVPVKPRLCTHPVDKCYVVFNAVKAYDVERSLDLVEKIAVDHGLLVMLQNGFGSLELAEERFHGRLKVACGVVYFGAERKTRTEVVYHGGDIIVAGCRRDLCFELLELSSILRIGGLELRVAEDIDYYRWLKLALNAVVNPVTAITKARNRVVLESEGLELARMILEEVYKAAEKYGYKFDLEKLLKYIEKSVKTVADNVSSMAQDVITGRKTEIDYINGYVVRVLGGEARVNRVLTLLVKLIEKNVTVNLGFTT